MKSRKLFPKGSEIFAVRIDPFPEVPLQSVAIIQIVTDKLDVICYS